jgi:hypothetical protein
MPIRDWKAALNQFAIVFDDRFPAWFFPLTQSIWHTPLAMEKWARYHEKFPFRR